MRCEGNGHTFALLKRCSVRVRCLAVPGAQSSNLRHKPSCFQSRPQEDVVLSLRHAFWDFELHAHASRVCRMRHGMFAPARVAAEFFGMRNLARGPHARVLCWELGASARCEALHVRRRALWHWLVPHGVARAAGAQGMPVFAWGKSEAA